MVWRCLATSETPALAVGTAVAARDMAETGRVATREAAASEAAGKTPRTRASVASRDKRRWMGMAVLCGGTSVVHVLRRCCAFGFVPGTRVRRA